MAQTIINVNIFAEAESAGEVDDPSNYSLVMSADFVNGVYELNGSPSTLTGLFDGTDPSGFDANGMAVRWNGSNWPRASAALLSAIWTALDDGLTFVFEVDYDGTPDNDHVFFISDNADIDSATNYIEMWPADGTIGSVNDRDLWFPNITPDWNIGYSGIDLTGIVRTALVMSRSNGTDYEYDVAYNGSFQEDLGTTAYTQKAKLSVLSAFYFGGYQAWGQGSSTAYIRKMKIYPAMSSVAALIASAEGIPLTITVDPFENAKKDFTFPSFRPYAAGGKPPYAYSIESGTLPAGLSIDEPTGVVSGTPTAVGTTSGLVLRVADANGATADSAPFSITVRERLLLLIDAKVSNSTTVSSVSFGEAHADRWIIVTTKFGTVNSMTIGGVTARSVTTGNVKTWYAKVPTGTSGNIVLGGAPGASVYYRIFAFYGAGLVVHDSRSASASSSPSISNIKQRSDGVFLGTIDYTGLENPAVAWTGLDELTFTDRQHPTAMKNALKYTDTDSGSADVSATTTPSTTSGLSVVSFMETGPELIGASTISYVTSGTTRTTTVPSGVQENDIMLVVVMHRSALTSIPSGWTLVASEDTNALSITQYCSVYKKNAGPSDAGTNITWTQTSAGRMAAQLLAWRSAAGTLSVLNSAQSSQDVDTTDSNIHTFPEVTGTADDQVFFVAASAISGSTGNTTITAPEEYFLSSTATTPENRLATAWRLGDNGEVSSGQFTTSLSGTTENGIAKVAVLIGL